jgi:hypothetical protein
MSIPLVKWTRVSLKWLLIKRFARTKTIGIVRVPSSMKLDKKYNTAMKQRVIVSNH